MAHQITSSSKSILGFTVPVLRIANLTHKTNWYITDKLNVLLINQHICTVDHISEAISKSKFKYICEAERGALNMAFIEVFKPFVFNEIQLSIAMTQWYTCWSWMQDVKSKGHPLCTQANKIDNPILADFKSDIQNNTNYDQVREAALVMVNLAEAMLKDGFRI